MSNFIPNTEIYFLPPSDSAPARSTREPVRIILIGSIVGINLIIAILHRLGFAEPRSWSKPQNDPATSQPMRILTKWIRH
ncbi:MAG: hypothetical protein HC929_13455 [Leptolyngbyaceae cyanobacterium SM2_5_2]|nr:hypothetical protein [Leptolyngbyaceae cyanobacterium SM2_5_2]